MRGLRGALVIASGDLYFVDGTPDCVSFQRGDWSMFKQPGLQCLLPGFLISLVAATRPTACDGRAIVGRVEVALLQVAPATPTAYRTTAEFTYLCPPYSHSMSADSLPIKTIVTNRRARFEYEILDRIEAGIVLTGTEVKSVREGNISLQESYAMIRGDELWLEGCTIAPYSQGNIYNHVPTRPRKLLLHRKELKKLIARVEEKGLTLVPLSIYFKGQRLKVEVAVARGKRLHDKRESIKQRDVERLLRRGGE